MKMEPSWLEEHRVKLLATENVTHDVKRFTLSKPESYPFKPGQATDIVINLPGWKNVRKPFTFTGLNDWDDLEFTIKIYPEHKGITDQLSKLKPGAELILHDVFGSIQYKGEGIFIAGGAGVTPFISIFRQLYKDGMVGNNQLFFSNKTSADIILKDEFERMLGRNFINTLTREKTSGYENSRIDKNYLKRRITDFSKYFYVCGPTSMIDSICESLQESGVDKNKLVFDRF